MVTEDYAPARFLRSRILTDAGFRVIQTDSVEGTLSAVLNDSTSPSLVLLDVGLPDGNGLELCERIKAAKPALPVVLISAIYRTADARRNGYSAGADAYLVDPTTPARLVETIHHLTSSDPQPPVVRRGIVRTTPAGYIVWVNEVAAGFLNVSERGAPGRSLLMFFNGDRPRLLEEIGRAVSGQVCEFETQLRPRDRRPFMVRIDLSAAEQIQSTELEWVIERADLRG